MSINSVGFYGIYFFIFSNQSCRSEQVSESQNFHSCICQAGCFPNIVPNHFSISAWNNDPTSTKRLQLCPYCPLSEFTVSLTFGCSCMVGITSWQTLPLKLFWKDILLFYLCCFSIFFKPPVVFGSNRTDLLLSWNITFLFYILLH